MTEAEWLACRDADLIVAALLIRERRPPGLLVRQAGLRRRLRLFCCACCRRVEPVLTEPDRRALRLAEQFAEKPGTFRLDRRPDYHVPSGAVTMALEGYAILVPHNVRVHVIEEARRLSRPEQEAIAREKAAQADLFHDVFGNPFRTVTVESAWLSPAVKEVARAAYEERCVPSGDLDRTRLTVLADALEEAGCTEQAILDHLREPGPHVPGCWAVDLALGRK